MEAVAHQHHEELPTAGALNRLALSATLHCLTGCAIGEIAGMVIGTALALSNGAIVVISVVLAFFFGYGLTSLPLLRSVPVNRALLARAKGHAAVHATGVHGGPPGRVVGAVAVLAGVFGAAVLIAEAVR